VHVATHALAGRDRARERVPDRMAALIVAQTGLVAAEAQALVAVLAVVSGVGWGAVVRVNHVTGRATAGAIVARMVVRAQETEQWIVQARLLQVQKNRIDAVERAQPSLGQPAQRPARRLGRRRRAELQLFLSSFLENSQNISGLTEGETR